MPTYSALLVSFQLLPVRIRSTFCKQPLGMNPLIGRCISLQPIVGHAIAPTERCFALFIKMFTSKVRLNTRKCILGYVDKNRLKKNARLPTNTPEYSESMLTRDFVWILVAMN